MLIHASLAAAMIAFAPDFEQGPVQSASQIDGIAKQVIPRVERAVGLKFRSPPTIAVRTSQQVHAYLTRKLDEDMPPEELENVSIAYRLFRLIPDTLNVRALLVALYSEQVVGYFDPDSATLYVVDRADPVQLKLVLAHELVHALQDQYVPLDSMLSVRKQTDRRNATQAVMEGQATLASIVAMMPGQDVAQMPDFWNQYRETVRQEQQRMPVFNRAPMVIREELIFPYLAGADFSRWFMQQFPDTVPFGRRLPVSTEQILHPDRYLAGDRPVDLRFAGAVQPLYDDNLGEFETRVFLTALSGSEAVGAAGALNWAGDRYGIFNVPGTSDHALVWWTLWDTDAAAKRFATLLEQDWPKVAKPGRKHSVEQRPVATHAAVRFVDAPPGWKGWQMLPVVATDETLPSGFGNPRAMRKVPQPLPKRD